MTTVTQGQALSIYPLDEYYQRHGLVLPRIEVVAPEEVPPPYHHLLVHEGDMTLRLQQFHGQPIGLRVIEHEATAQCLKRTVVLVRQGDNRPVEFGSIRIPFAPFPPEAQREIAACQRPLGTILRGLHLGHYSRPIAFIRFWADEHVGQALNVAPDTPLYGRCNELFDRFHQRLAQVVEILPVESGISSDGVRAK